jgi:hypothetical protein
MPSREAINKQKVYTKDQSFNIWVQDKTLFWAGGEGAIGNKQSSFANIMPITPEGINIGAGSGVATQAEVDAAKLRMQYGLEEYLGLSGTGLDEDQPKGKYILVTKLDAQGVERPRFIGQAWRVTRNFDGKQMTNTAVAVGYDRMLAGFGLFGAAHMDTDGAATHFDTAPGIFNERTRPNRSSSKQAMNGNDTYVFDYQMAKSFNGSYWSAENVVEYILNRLVGQNAPAEIYPFHNNITNTQLSLVGPSPFTKPKIRQYDPNETNLWAIITQMVESGGGFTTTIKYEGTTPATSYAKIGVIENG